MEDKVAIIYHCINNQGKDYRMVEICSKDAVVNCAKRAMRLSTEIVRYEVCSSVMGVK